MALFNKKIGPIFLKETSDAEDFITKMNGLSERASGELKTEIEKQIKIASYGIAGEKNVDFELRNSNRDMYILHDIYLECDDMSAQIDYMVFTRKRTYIIECKNLIGNIEIDSNGSFIRQYELFGKKIKEGIYSPITQNERHLEVIKKIRANSKGNIITKSMFEKYFYDNYVSLVVLANPKTILNDRFAKKQIKEKVIRADQLIATIKAKDDEVKDYSYSDKDMEEVAHFFLNSSVPNKTDYCKKYEEMLEQINVTEKQEEETSVEMIATDEEKRCPRCGNNLVLRTAKKGDNVGNQFWGCSNFPKCRYIENV